MRHKFWIPIAFFALLLLPACGEDSPTDDGGNTPPPPNDMSESLAEYWDAQDDMTEALFTLNTLMDDIESAIDRGVRSQDQMDEVEDYIDDYVAQSVVAAAKFEALIDLEDDIVPYGDRGMFTNFVGGVCKGVFNAAKNGVVSSGQMVRSGWRLFSGSHTMREVLSAPDSGIPLVSNWAQDLQRSNQRRNDYIAFEIESGDTNEGNVPYDELEGSTAQEKANAYRNLPADHPIKKEAHRNFLLWSEDGWEDCLKTLKDASKTGVKAYAEAVSGSGELAEIGDQLTSTGQEPDAKAVVTPEIKNVETSAPIAEPQIMIISKRDQPESDPKIVVLAGIDPEFEVELPEGSYDIITIADEYVRAAEIGLEVITDQATGFLAELMVFASNSLVIESVTATPDVAGFGETVSCSASAASTIGSSLSFDWEITGGAFSAFSQSGHTCSFKPNEEYVYTVTVTVTDDFGTEKSKSTSVTATPVEIDVIDFTIASEVIVDNEFNPGEQLVLNLDIRNSSDSDLTGDIYMTAESGITFPSGTINGVFIASDATVTKQITVLLPVDYSSDSGVITFHYVTADVDIYQDLEFDVDFYVEINAITSPVTERILNVSGRVANPSLASAHLVIDGDYEQLYEVALTSGIFSQQIIVEASAEEEDHVITILADSGSWHEEDTQAFSSQVPPAGFRVTLTWDTGGTDVDLWVTDPFGTKCYFGNRFVEASGLTLDVDNTSGYGPENISSEAPPSGLYLVQVHYWSDHNSEEAIGSNCSIVIREHEGTEDETVRYYSGYLGDSGDIWTVTTLDVGTRSGFSGEPIDEYGFIDPASLPAK